MSECRGCGSVNPSGKGYMGGACGHCLRGVLPWANQHINEDITRRTEKNEQEILERGIEIQRIHDLIQIRASDAMYTRSYRYGLLYPAANVMRHALECLRKGMQHEDYDISRVQRMLSTINALIKSLEDNN